MTNRIEMWIFAVMAALLFGGCATEPPPLPPNNPADPQVRSLSKAPRNLLVKDETTHAIEKQLNATQAYAESAEKMEHDMSNMPGMEQGQMQHGEMKHDQNQDHEQMAPKNTETEKKALADEMKKTSQEMKKTSEALKEKTGQAKAGAAVYTCPMHPQVRSDEPGKCPICGMTLVKKEQAHEKR